MKLSPWRILTVFLMTVFPFATSAHADSTLYNNLPNAPGTVLGTFPIGAPPVGAGPEGDSFSTVPSQFLLTNVFVALQGVQDSNSFTISLYSDNNTSCAPGPTCTGGPLTLLDTIATVNDNSLSTTLADYDFTLATPQTLFPNTRYWIIASSTNGSGTLWSYTQDLSGIGVSGEFNTTSFNLGLAPNSTEAGCIVNGVNICTPFQMEVTGNMVPEPGTLALLGTGLLGMAGAIRRKLRT